MPEQSVPRHEFDRYVDNVKDMFEKIHARLDNGSEIFHQVRLAQQALRSDLNTNTAQYQHTAKYAQDHALALPEISARVLTLEKDMEHFADMPADLREMRSTLTTLCATAEAKKEGGKTGREWLDLALRFFLPFIMLIAGFIAADWRAMKQTLPPEHTKEKVEVHPE